MSRARASSRSCGSGGPSRRALLAGIAGFGGTASLAACGGPRLAPAHRVGPPHRAVLPARLTPPPLGPPPAPGSPEERRELDELAALRARGPGAAPAPGPWSVGVAARWHELARDRVARTRLDLLAASRLYALLSVAQHDACYFAEAEQRRLRRPTPARRAPGLRAMDLGFSYPSIEGSIAAASRAVLTHFFPSERPFFDAQLAELAALLVAEGRAAASDLGAGGKLGDGVGAGVVAFAETDGADAALTPGSVSDGPSGPAHEPGVWVVSPGREPLGARWGEVRPWVMADVLRFRAPAPPAPSSEAFKRGLSEVRRLSDQRSREQKRLAALWADGVGSYTPAGRWNKIAADLMMRMALTEAQAVRAFALLNMALMDAGIASWESKFHYRYWRPYQVDAQITTPVGRPEFPSYTSAHAAFSGAAAGVLAALFPSERASLEARSREAAVSRMYGGIHYPFDADAGLAQGQAVAAAALAWGRASS